MPGDNLTNTKESPLPVCDKPYKKKKEKYETGEDGSFAGLCFCVRQFALLIYVKYGSFQLLAPVCALNTFV